MTGDWQIHVLDVVIEWVMEKLPANVEEPGCESGQKGVDACKKKVFGAVALPLDDVLEHRNAEAHGHRGEHRHEAHPRSGDLGGDKHPADLHDLVTMFRFAMGT